MASATVPVDEAVRPRAAGALFAVALLAAMAVRVRLLDVPFERDEGEYAYVGQLLLRGIAPFKESYNMKLPGTHATYALAMALFGQSVAGARIGLLLVNSATSVLMFLLGRRLLGGIGGLAAGTSFAWLSLATGMLGMFGHATQFVVLPAVGGLLVLLHACDSQRAWSFVAAGLLFGLAILMKQPGAVFLAFAVAWVAWVSARARPRQLGRAGRQAALLCLGAAAPVVLTSALLAVAGAFDQFWFWTVQYGWQYARPTSLAEGFANLSAAVSRFVPESLVLWGLAGAGLVLLALPATGRRFTGERPFVVALLACSALGVTPGLHFREHYFVLLVPAAALLVGVAARTLATWTAGRLGALVAPALALAAGCGQASYAQRDVFLRLAPNEVAGEIYGTNPFPEAVAIGSYLREHTSPDERIAVIGSEPQILFYSGRRSATGYLYTYALMEEQPYALTMQEQMIREIESGRPSHVVFVGVSTSWLRRPGSDPRIFDWTQRYLAAFEPVGAIAIDRSRGTEYRWGSSAAGGGTGEPCVVVFRRR